MVDRTVPEIERVTSEDFSHWAIVYAGQVYYIAKVNEDCAPRGLSSDIKEWTSHILEMFAARKPIKLCPVLDYVVARQPTPKGVQTMQLVLPHGAVQKYDGTTLHIIADRIEFLAEMDEEEYRRHTKIVIGVVEELRAQALGVVLAKS